jgi:quercetin dioxygenase-like cupin family protein
MAVQAGAHVVGPGEGKRFSGRAGGYVLETKATDDHTRGAYAFQEMTVAPGFPWIPPHIHRNEDEALYGLEGEVAVRVGDEVHASGRGRTSSCRGVVHTFSNPGRSRRGAGRQLPGRVIGYFEEAAALTTPHRPAGPTWSSWPRSPVGTASSSSASGCTPAGPWSTSLRRRHRSRCGGRAGRPVPVAGRVVWLARRMGQNRRRGELT